MTVLSQKLKHIFAAVDELWQIPHMADKVRGLAATRKHRWVMVKEVAERMTLTGISYLEERYLAHHILEEFKAVKYNKMTVQQLVHLLGHVKVRERQP